MSDMDNFVTLSAALTGISAQRLSPAIDPAGTKQELFDRAQAGGRAAFAKALAIVQAAATASPAPGANDLANLLLNKSGDDVRYICRSVMLMWFLGSWYAPDELKLFAAKDPPMRSIRSAVISANAYTRGWVWSAAQAHPMGYSNLHFGYWGEQPPQLSDFVS